MVQHQIEHNPQDCNNWHGFMWTLCNHANLWVNQSLPKKLLTSRLETNHIVHYYTIHIHHLQIYFRALFILKPLRGFLRKWFYETPTLYKVPACVKKVMRSSIEFIQFIRVWFVSDGMRLLNIEKTDSFKREKCYEKVGRNVMNPFFLGDNLWGKVWQSVF